MTGLKTRVKSFLTKSKKYRRKMLPFFIGIIAIIIPIIYFSLQSNNTPDVEAWWDAGAAWEKRKQVRLTNDSSENLAADTTVAVTVDTSALYQTSDVQSDCDDLRVVYHDGTNDTELNRHVSH